MLLYIISELRCLSFGSCIIIILVFSSFIINTYSTIWLGYFDLISLELRSKQ
jgi:hypothetical protein